MRRLPRIRHISVGPADVGGAGSVPPDSGDPSGRAVELSDINNPRRQSRTRDVARRTASILTVILAVGVALAGGASASAAQKSTKHRSCPTAKAHPKRKARCRVRRHRKTARHLTNRTADDSSSAVIGLNASVAGWSDMAGRLDQVLSTSATKWLREDFEWSEIEPQPGTFDFSRFDEYMLLTAEHHTHVLPVLFDAPSWAAPAEDAIPSDPSAYAAYVGAVVARYGPHGSFWAQHPNLANYAPQTFEIWNEPYYSNGDNGDYDPGAYARLVRAAAIAGRRADPAAHFLLAAENQAQLVNGTWVWWIDALYHAVPDLNNYFDGVAVHPYGTNMTSLSFPTPGRAYNGYEQIRRVQAIHQEFAAHNAARKRLWITEIGWPTCTSGSDRCTTPAGQAADLTTVFNYARTSWKSFLAAVFVYSFDDSHAEDPTSPENDYGLAYNNGTPKPALGVFRANATSSAVAAR
jgi:polysaccharide biosynthesis protein PslG